jgi:hypothetical protein
MKIQQGTGVVLHDEGGNIITLPLIEVFFSSDILFYAIALGKEGSATWWCTYCDLKRDQWQQAGHAAGTNWDIERLNQNADDLTAESTVMQRKGAKTRPNFQSVDVSVDVDHYIISLLHITIGKGNGIFK